MYYQLPSLDRQEKNILLLLIWSYQCPTGVPRALQAWATSEGGQHMHRRLIEEIILPNTLAKIALILVAFLCLLQFHNEKSSKVYIAESSHLKEFLYLLKGYPSTKRQATMEQASWSFFIVVSALPDVSEGQKMKVLQLFASVFNIESPMESSNEGLNRYWKARLNPSQSHNKALCTISDVLEKLALPITLVLLAQDETSTSIDSDILTETGFHESSRDLVRKAREKVSKGRSCCRWW